MEWPWCWEGNIQKTLAHHLSTRGWIVRSLADTEAKEPGIDLLAERDNRWLAVEVKGYPSAVYDHGLKKGQPKPTQPTNQARQWFSHALLAMMLLRQKRPDAEIAICLPDFPTYRSLVNRTARSFQLLGFGVYFVPENGDVKLELSHRPVSIPRCD